MDTTSQAGYMLAVFKGNISEAARFIAKSTVMGKKGAKDYRRTLRRALKGEGISKTEQQRINNAFNLRIRKQEGLTATEWKQKKAIAQEEYNGRMYPEQYCVFTEAEVEGLINDAKRAESTFKRLGIPYGITMFAEYAFTRSDGIVFNKTFYAKARNDPIVLAKDCVDITFTGVLEKKMAWETGAGSDSGQGDITEQLVRWCVRIFKV